MSKRKKNIFEFSGPGIGVLNDLKSTDPQEIGDELMRLEKAGTNSPEEIVDSARNPESPLHNLFDWSDTEAAKQWRLHQARTLVCTVRVVLDSREQDARSKSIRAFVKTPSPEDKEKPAKRPHYTSISNALKDPSTRARILEQAQAELIAWRERYDDLRELAAIFEIIDQQLLTKA